MHDHRPPITGAAVRLGLIEANDLDDDETAADAKPALGRPAGEDAPLDGEVMRERS